MMDREIYLMAGQ